MYRKSLVTNSMSRKVDSVSSQKNNKNMRTHYTGKSRGKKKRTQKTHGEAG